MPDFNSITIEGNLGKDPKLEFSSDGNYAHLDFSVAQFVGAKDKEGKFASRWWNVRFSSRINPEKDKNEAEELIARLHKGDRVVVYGYLSGWIPESEYEKESKWDGYKANINLILRANNIVKIDKPGEKRVSNREEMPPIK